MKKFKIHLSCHPSFFAPYLKDGRRVLNNAAEIARKKVKNQTKNDKKELKP